MTDPLENVPLFVRGRIPHDGIAIIGSRTPPPAAELFTFELARRIGEAIVSGLAPGIDAAAHRGALASGLPTVAYVGYGFGRTEPIEHERLEQAIVSAGGAVATQLSPGMPATVKSLIARDRLQAEHARAVVLICSELEGGAMHTMRFARELGKPRFAVLAPDDRNPVWEGNRRSIAEGALPLPFDVDAALRYLRSAHNS